MSDQVAVASELRACRRVRELREARGWSQTDLAREMGRHGFEMHQTTVAKLEKGERPLRVAELTTLARIFERTIADMLGEPAEPVADLTIQQCVGRNVKQLRTTRGMSQAALGEALAPLLGKPWERQAVSAAEIGKRAFGAADLAALAVVLNVSPGRLFEIPLHAATVHLGSVDLVNEWKADDGDE